MTFPTALVPHLQFHLSTTQSIKATVKKATPNSLHRARHHQSTQTDHRVKLLPIQSHRIATHIILTRGDRSRQISHLVEGQQTQSWQGMSLIFNNCQGRGGPLPAHQLVTTGSLSCYEGWWSGRRGVRELGLRWLGAGWMGQLRPVARRRLRRF